MSNLNENLQKAVDVILTESTAKKVSDIILKAQNENLTAEQSAIEADKYVTELIMPFYEPHKDEMPIDTFKYLLSLPKEMRTFSGYGKLQDNKNCEIMTKEELLMKWCNEYDLLVSDINYQKDKIKRGKVQQLHLCIQDLKSLTLK